MTKQLKSEKTDYVHPIRNKVGGIFIHVSNMERSVNWYHRLLGMPQRSAATEKVHAITMDGGSELVLDQNGYDSGLAWENRAQLMLDSPDVGAAYRYVKKCGIEIVEDIMQFPGMAFFTFRDPDGNLLMVCGNPGSIEGPETDTESVKRATDNVVAYDAGGLLLTASEQASLAQITSSGLELTGHAYAEGEFETPLRIEATVRIDQGSMYLTFASGMVAINYGNSPEVLENGTGSDLFVVHPKLNTHFTFHRKGSVPIGQWVHVSWTIEERRMEVHVDGKLFHRQDGYFGGINGQTGISGVMGRVTVKSLAVESIAPESQAIYLPISGSAASEDHLTADAACHAVVTSSGLWLSGGEELGFARTGHVYNVPFAFRTELHSFTRSAVIYGGYTTLMKWNSDGKLLFIDPATREEIWIDGAALPYDTTATIEWRLENKFMSLIIDDKTVLERKGDYSGCRFRLGIGAEAGSAVTVKSVIINQI
ncbi:VOC family protein [Paenibacillus xylaniclasticus]|uniref:VOC family protein n=1 Tax=Paenibacillus xylaniclasticus TaxID=588083 RepID=UPI000FDBF275|nr:MULTISPECIES: VOC family protein [Paenibacillus]GFN32995.1 hypothetical protein PCURB6_32550 [Paenibacillus curdlanolyticus]